jgi:hypothetical protein
MRKFQDLCARLIARWRHYTRSPDAGPVLSDTVRKEERFMLGNSPPSGIRQRRHAEIRPFAPFELCRKFNQSRGWFVDAKPKPFFPTPSVVLC